MNKFGQWAVNITVGIFCFLFFLVIFFPINSIVMDRLAAIETQTGGNVRVSVAKVDASLLFKSVFKDVQVSMQSDTGSDVVLNFPEVRVGIHYLPLMAGTVSGSFDAKGKKGSAGGSFSFSSSETEIELALKDLDLGSFPILASSLKVPLEGNVGGTVDLDLATEDQFMKHKGKVDLKFSNLKLGPGHLNLSGFDLDLPEMGLALTAPGSIQLDLNQGKAEIKSIVFPGEDLVLNLTGSVRLNRKWVQYRVDAQGNFKVSQKVVEALPFLSILDAKKSPDGSYSLALSDRLTKPRILIAGADPFGGMQSFLQQLSPPGEGETPPSTAPAPAPTPAPIPPVAPQNPE